jgi:hypothetical protein
MVISITIILAGVAIFTAYRLYQLRQESVAPNAPESAPKAAEESTSPSPTPTPAANNCPVIAFTVSSATPTPTTTATPTPTPTSTATPGPANSCGGTCGDNTNCQSGLYCYQGYCRNPSCPDETSCSCPAATITATAATISTLTPTATPEAALPTSGIGWPTILGISLGSFVLILSFVLAL